MKIKNNYGLSEKLEDKLIKQFNYLMLKKIKKSILNFKIVNKFILYITKYRDNNIKLSIKNY
jgi:hypothetical protein